MYRQADTILCVLYVGLDKSIPPHFVHIFKTFC